MGHTRRAKKRTLAALCFAPARVFHARLARGDDALGRTRRKFVVYSNLGMNVFISGIQIVLESLIDF